MPDTRPHGAAVLAHPAPPPHVQRTCPAAPDRYIKLPATPPWLLPTLRESCGPTNWLCAGWLLLQRWLATALPDSPLETQSCLMRGRAHDTGTPCGDNTWVTGMAGQTRRGGLCTSWQLPLPPLCTLLRTHHQGAVVHLH